MTDITGFGLAGHAGEMARASRVTIHIRTSCLPCLPGARELLRQNYRTRASDSNRQFASKSMRIEAAVEAELAEFAFDAQTSGGLLISLPSGAAEALIVELQQVHSSQAHSSQVEPSQAEPKSANRAAWLIGSVERESDVDLVLEA